MMYGELGRYPIYIIIKKRMVGFGYNLINKENKLSSIIYRFMFNHANVHNFEYKWLLAHVHNFEYKWLANVHNFEYKWLAHVHNFEYKWLDNVYNFE